MSSYYEGLPIYKSATDVVVSLDKVVRGFSRYHKYTLGSRMREAAIDVVMLVARANRREDRARLVPKLCHRVEELRLLINLGREVEAFSSFQQFAQVMEQVMGVTRQAEGWRKSMARSVGPEPKQPPPQGGRS
ncbi:four helix bundle protein [Sorangium sp. So ce542]|uniref:four helix bundle protein n=1 Tax=Sorangium sp. So ce542 TaxID=3133316 RepID=UPI003F609C28